MEEGASLRVGTPKKRRLEKERNKRESTQTHQSKPEILSGGQELRIRETRKYANKQVDTGQRSSQRTNVEWRQRSEPESLRSQTNLEQESKSESLYFGTKPNEKRKEGRKHRSSKKSRKKAVAIDK